MPPNDVHHQSSVDTSQSNRAQIFLLLSAKIIKNILYIVVIALLTIILYERFLLENQELDVVTTNPEISQEEKDMQLIELSKRTPDISDEEKELSLRSLLINKNIVSVEERQKSFNIK
ncbi:MAG: hypothetical protein FGM57_01155 [Candidatus Taylorbacteria bacterium]|nr:hypothetical protein [Candidatus Taylorbacteria bacterium]